jgi:hypothetical protein
MIHTWRLERKPVGPGQPDFYIRRTGRRPWRVAYDGDVVPPFDGPEAWFEVETLPGKPVRFVRQVERPGGR